MAGPGSPCKGWKNVVIDDTLLSHMPIEGRTVLHALFLMSLVFQPTVMLINHPLPVVSSLDRIAEQVSTF